MGTSCRVVGGGSGHVMQGGRRGEGGLQHAMVFLCKPVMSQPRALYNFYIILARAILNQRSSSTPDRTQHSRTTAHGDQTSNTR